MINIPITACVLTFNGGDRVIPTLESLKLQTYPYKDLVIADDASTDSGYTVSIIEGWLKKNSKYFTNVRFIKNPQNLGIVENLKNSASHANGEIIFPLGQGDMCYGPSTFHLIAKEIQNTHLEKKRHPLLWIGYYRSYKSLPNWHPVKNTLSLPFHFNIVNNRKKALKALIDGGFIGAPSLVYTKQLFANYPPIPEDIRDCEDFPLIFYFIFNNIMFGKLDFFMRWYEDGVGISSNLTPKYIESLKACNKFILSLLENDISLTKEVLKRTYLHEPLNQLTLLDKLKIVFVHPFRSKHLIIQKIFDIILIKIYIPIFVLITKPKSGEAFHKNS